jgi:hypothetical protein
MSLDQAPTKIYKGITYLFEIDLFCSVSWIQGDKWILNLYYIL